MNGRKLDTDLMFAMCLVAKLLTKYDLSYDLGVASFSSEAKLHRHGSAGR
jgi:hypothetical protein